MFWKTKRQPDETEIISCHLEYSRSIELINGFCGRTKGTAERLDFLEYALDVIRTDLIASYQAKQFYREIIRKEANPFPFPDRFRCAEKIEVDLAATPVFTVPRKRDSIIELLPHLKKERFAGNDNHRAIHYPYMDICYVYDGVHSVTIGKYYKTGVITAETYDMRKVYETIYVDGEKWRYKNTGDMIADVFDYRLAVIFEIGRMIAENLSP